MSETAAGTIAQLAWTVGPWQIVLVLVLILILFGGRKLPELARGLGRGLREFRNELRGIKKDIEEEPEEKQADDEEKPSGKQPDATAGKGRSDKEKPE